MTNDSAPTVDDARSWLIDRLATITQADPATIASSATFTDLGLSSVRAVELAVDLGDHLGRELPATLIYDYPSIDLVAAYVAGIGRTDDPAQVG